MPDHVAFFVRYAVVGKDKKKVSFGQAKRLKSRTAAKNWATRLMSKALESAKGSYTQSVGGSHQYAEVHKGKPGKHEIIITYVERCLPSPRKSVLDDLSVFDTHVRSAWCSTCRSVKPADEFVTFPEAKSGYRHKCAECAGVQNAA